MGVRKFFVPTLGVEEMQEKMAATKAWFGFSWVNMIQAWKVGNMRHSNKSKERSKENRCLAQYSLRATTTNQPTNRAPSEPAMDKNANFGQIWTFLGQKS